MTSQSEPQTVTELLDAALTPVLAGPARISDLTRLSGGASRETWSFRAQGRPLVLRRDPPGRPGPAGAMRNEADVIRACGRAGLSVPELILHSDSGALGTDGIVVTAVGGETIPRRILRDPDSSEARLLLTAQVAEFLAGLHALDPAQVPGVSETDDVTTYRAAYEYVEDTSPTFERTFEWLASNPRSSGRRTLVHGDLRMGNLIVDQSGLAAVIDWELMHLGDPVEDLAWFCVKAWRFGSPLAAGGVGTIDEFVGAYEAASGYRVDREVFHWWLVEKTLIWGVIAMGQAHAHLSGAVRSHELAAIGRRVAEQEWDLVELLAPDSARRALVERSELVERAAPDPAERDSGERDSAERDRGGAGIYGRPTAEEILEAVRWFLTDDVIPNTTGRLSYNSRVAANMLAVVERQLAARSPDEPTYDTGSPGWDALARVVLAKVQVANPQWPGTTL